MEALSFEPLDTDSDFTKVVTVPRIHFSLREFPRVELRAATYANQDLCVGLNVKWRSGVPDPDLVLIHGGRHGAWCWSLFIECLVDQFHYSGRIAALDVPGCGSKRERSMENISLDDIAVELNSEIRAAGLEKPLLIGHSMAGILLPRMWVADPTLCSELVHISTSAPKEGQTIIDMMGSSVHGVDPDRVGWPVDPNLVSGLQLAKAMFGVGMSEEQFHWVLEEARKDFWPPLTRTEPVSRVGYDGSAPCSYIITLRDPILPVAWQGRFAERLGANRMFMLNTPHAPFITHPTTLAALLCHDLIGRYMEACS